MFDNTNSGRENTLDKQLKKDYITSEIAKFFEEKLHRSDKLEKKILSDIQSIEVLKYEFCDMMKYSKIYFNI